MITVLEIYVIGMIVAFVMAIILAFHYERTRKEEQQLGVDCCRRYAVLVGSRFVHLELSP